MAQATTFRYSKFVVSVGDGASPETFAAPCGLNSASLTISSATNDVNVPDCDNPDLPSWLERDVVSESWSLTGAGVLASEALDTWFHWKRDIIRNITIELLDDDGNPVYAWQGSAILSELTIAGERGQRVTVNITVTGDGELVPTVT